MDTEADLLATEFEKELQGLDSLTREEIVALVTARAVQDDDEEGFTAVAQSLSLETLRLVSARALVVARSHRRPPLAWLAPGFRTGEPAPRALAPSRNRVMPALLRARASAPSHMSLSRAADVPALPGAPELPSTPVVSGPVLPCLPAGPAAPPAPGAPSRAF